MDQKEVEMHETGDSHESGAVRESDDSKADAFAAVILTSVFVAVCIFWISGQ